MSKAINMSSPEDTITIEIKKSKLNESKEGSKPAFFELLRRAVTPQPSVLKKPVKAKG